MLPLLTFALYLATAAAVVAWWRRFRAVTVAGALVLVALPLLFTGSALLRGRVYAPADLPYMSAPLKDYARDFGIEQVHNGTLSDLYCQIMPWGQAVRWSLSRGAWPLINPFMLFGDILAQSAQSAPYDPINLLGMLLPMGLSLTYGATMTFFLAGFFTYAFARARGMSEIAALIAASSFMFCSILTFFVGWPLSRSWAYMPLVLLGVHLVVEAMSLRTAAVLTAGLTLVMLAGHPESILHIVFIGVLYGLFELAGKRTLKPVLLAIGAGVVAFGLSAIFILPFLEALPQTAESRSREIFAASDFVTDRHFIAGRAALALLPWYGGTATADRTPTANWSPQSMRVGSVALALALAALVCAWRRRETWFFLALALFCGCAALSAPPVTQFLHSLPLFRIALNERLAYGGAFALAMLAGIAIDQWESRPRSSTVPAVLLLALIALLTWRLAPVAIAAGIDKAWLQPLAAAELLPLLLTIVLLLSRVPARIAGPVILSLILLQRAAAEGGLYPAIRPEAFYPRVPILAKAQGSGGAPYRVVGHHFAFIPDTAAFYQLQDPRGYQAMTFRRLTETYDFWSTPQPVSFNGVGDLTRPFLSLANVRYAISSEAAAPTGWRMVMRDRETSLFENEQVLGRAFVPRRIRYEQFNAQVLAEMREARDFSDLGWIIAPEVPPHEIVNGPGRVTVREQPNSYDIDAVMENDGWVVISNAAWKGWRAYVDGKRVRVHFADHAFIGVFVPRGSHALRLNYLPDSFVLGRKITASTIVLLILLAVWSKRRARMSKVLTAS